VPPITPGAPGVADARVQVSLGGPAWTVSAQGSVCQVCVTDLRELLSEDGAGAPRQGQVLTQAPVNV